MVITKSQITFHKKLNMIFQIFKKSDGREILFIDDNTIYFATYYIAGSVFLKYMNVAEQMQDGFYQIRQLPRKDFVLEKIQEDKEHGIDKDNYIVKSKVMEIIESRKYVFHVDDSNHSIADIVNRTHLKIRDSHLSMIAKMSDYDVFEVEKALILEQMEEKEKEGLIAYTNIVFMCMDDEADETE